MSSTVTATKRDNAAVASAARDPATAIGDNDVETADAAVARMRAAARSRSAAEAELAAAIVGVANLCDDREHDGSEVAAVLAWSTRFAESEVGWCRHLIEELPTVFTAWRAGQIDRCRARVFEDCLAPLILGGNGDHARAAAERVLPEAGRITAPRLRAKLLRLVLKIDPLARRKQTEQTIADRDVWLGDGGDGATASLTAFYLPVARAAAAFERVDAIARARRAGGDARTLSQLRADTVLDLLDGTGCDSPPIGRQGVLELQIPLATAIGADTTPGELAGYGPVLADVARQIARERGDAQWRFNVTYRGELVYQGITDARPGPVKDRDQAGNRRPAAAPPASATTNRVSASTTEPPVRPPGGRWTYGADAHRPATDGSSEPGTRGAVADGPGASRADALTPANSTPSTSRPVTGDPGTGDPGTGDPGTGGSAITHSETSDSRLSRPASDGEADDGQTHDSQTHDRHGLACVRSGSLGRPIEVDGGSAGSKPGLTDFLTDRPITAVDEHTPHPPLETDPRRRFPGEKLKRWVAARDRTCRAPGCHAPARVCQFDHTIDYADGGPTSHDDLALLCVHHHTEKHAGWWTVIQPAPGRVYWITPHGHIYRQSE